MKFLLEPNEAEGLKRPLNLPFRLRTGDQRFAVLLSVALPVFLLLVPVAASGTTSPESFWTRCAVNTAADVQCSLPRGIATTPEEGAASSAAGHVFVADSANSTRRILEFDAWGQFIRAWGGDVVQSGPDDRGTGFEICLPANGDVCKGGVTGAAAGTFRSPQGVAVDSGGNVYVLDRGLPSNQRVQKFDSDGNFLRAWGPGVVGGGAVGTGELNAGSTTVTGVSTTSKAFEVGQTLTSSGGHIPAEAKITALGAGTLTLSQAATGSGTETLDVAVGAGNVANNEVQTVSISGAPTGGDFTLTFSVPDPSPSVVTSAPIPFNASAAVVQSQLESLSNIGIGNIAVSGPAGGPFTVEFKGARFADTNVNTISANGAGLTPSGSVSVATTIQGASSAEICTVAASCKAGVEDIAGPGPGQFGDLAVVGNYIAVDTANTATTVDDRVYVGDKGRIQRFDSDGNYQGQINVPGQTTLALAVDPAGNLYAAFCGVACGNGEPAKPNVGKWSSAGVEQPGVTVSNPQALASGPNGNLYVMDGTTVRQFSPVGTEILEEETIFPFFPSFPFSAGTGISTGIAIGDFCWNDPDYDLYVTNAALAPNGFMRAYGPPPNRFTDPGEPCEPLPHAPEIEDQGTVLVEADYAAVQATINPQWWNDASYHVQFATAACVEAEGWDAACVSQRPASPNSLGAKNIATGVKTAKVKLPGLIPQTPYLFRFATQSSGGGPVFGRGGTESSDGEAATFTTLAIGESDPEPTCPNRVLRAGVAARLPDCRAYEMVSPVDKNGGDIHPPKNGPYVQASTSGGRIAYSAIPAFGDQLSNKVTNQYVADRMEDSHGGGGWLSDGINAPLGRHLVSPTEPILYPLPEVSAFSPDLCNEWLVDYNVTPLTPAGQPGYVNLYRQSLCGAPHFEALTATPLTPGVRKLFYLDKDAIQGFSKDLSHVLFVARAGLSPGTTAGDVNGLIYDYSGGSLHLVSVLPSAVPDPGLLDIGSAVGGGVSGLFAGGYLANAVSNDGARVYWSSKLTYPSQGGVLFLRSNPAQPESVHLHGTAMGTGDLIGKAKGKGTLTNGSATVKKVKVDEGSFAVHQSISGEGVPAGAMITAIEEEEVGGEKFLRLTLSAKATKGNADVVLSGSASNTVYNVTTQAGSFAVDQEISSSNGIAPETTVIGVDSGEHTITLSTNATATQVGAGLSATSECTEAARACTVPVSKGFATFWSATADGSTALFSEGGLAKDESKATLYMYDATTEARVAIVDRISGVLGASEDLSRVYFISTDALTPGQSNGGGDEARAGEPNLYLYEDGTLTFIGTLLDGDVVGEEQIARHAYSIGYFNPFYNTVRVTPDGDRIAFESRARLTGFDNTDAESGKADLEVFTYKAGGALHCVSCSPSNVRPDGRELPEANAYPESSSATGVEAAAWIPGWRSPLDASNVLSETGKRLFFMSNIPLVRRDTNGVQDVYEWEAPGEGSCKEGSLAYRELNGGCIYLISTGESPSESEFWDASPNGRDVFFTTESSLVSQDPGSIDLYDARVDGGFTQSALRQECEGDTCQNSPLPPSYPASSSSTYRAAEPIRRCGKHKVRRRGRCVVKRHRTHAGRRHVVKRTATEER